MTDQTEANVVVMMSGVNEWFSDLRVFHGIDLTVKREMQEAICGPSGLDTWTLIRCANKLESINARNASGDGIVLGLHQSFREIWRSVGMVVQLFHLFLHLTLKGAVVLASMWTLEPSRASMWARATHFVTSAYRGSGPYCHRQSIRHSP
ncbi:MAG: hypothetical protein AAF493_02310 [Pseudomonadota bacterium]